jgi:hypothetical protein
MAKVCPRCAADLSPEEAACGVCGQAVAPSSAVATVEKVGEAPAAPATPQPVRPSRRWRLLTRVVVLLLVLAGLVAVAIPLIGWNNVRAWLIREGLLQPQELSLRNTATFTGFYDSKGRARYEWTAYIEGPPSKLREIQSVQYHLHEGTFSPSVRNVPVSPEDGFALTMTGWGTFRLRATVFFKDGTTLELSHDLEF